MMITCLETINVEFSGLRPGHQLFSAAASAASANGTINLSTVIGPKRFGIYLREGESQPKAGAMDVLHELDALATWQGGFGYYFSTQEEPAVWDQAQGDLRRIGLADAAELFGVARDLYLKCDHVDAEQAAVERYMAEMHELDVRWRQYVPAFHQALADWRSKRGLEEFGQVGW